MIDPKLKEIALRLVEYGIPIKTAARACGIDRTTLKRWLSPEYAERRRQTYQKVIEENSALFCERLKQERRQANRQLWEEITAPEPRVK